MKEMSSKLLQGMSKPSMLLFHVFFFGSSHCLPFREGGFPLTAARNPQSIWGCHGECSTSRARQLQINDSGVYVYVYVCVCVCVRSSLLPFF